MGMNSQAHLVYGYDLGGKDKGWNFTKRETKHLHWIDAIGETNDFHLELMEVLLHDAGWIETDWRTDATYFKRKAELKNSLGVDVARCGSYDFSGYLLHTKKFSVEWDAGFVLTYVEPIWATLLNNALDTLGIVPTQTEPKWILASFYG